MRARARRAWRRRLGLAPGTRLLASLGFVIPKKQIAETLTALARLPKDIDWHYVIGGEDRDPEVRETCARLRLESRVTFLDYLDEADFDGVLAAADLLINLRFPTSGETSGTVCRALAAGLPCLISDHGWYGELPQSVTYRVPPCAKVEAPLAQVPGNWLSNGTWLSISHTLWTRIRPSSIGFIRTSPLARSLGGLGTRGKMREGHRR